MADYRPEALVARGTLADVYRASSSRGPVVLKVLRPEHRASAAHRLMLLDEGELLARLEHPNLVRCLDVLEPIPALVLEAVTGSTVEALLAARRPPPTTALRVARGVAAALACLHARGVVHHGVLPGNVMLTPLGRVVLLDLGHGEWPGRRVTITRRPSLDNVPYACPELWEGQRVGAPGDVYRLGVLLAHLCTGRPPALAGRARLGERHPGVVMPRGLPGDLAALLARLTARAPGERPAAAEARDALATIAVSP